MTNEELQEKLDRTMTPIEKLKAMGHERVAEILATEVMGWMNLTCSDNEIWWCSKYDDAGTTLKRIKRADFKPCADLNHAQLVIDKVRETRLIAPNLFYVIFGYCEEIGNHEEIDRMINATAEQRCAAAVEALGLWSEGAK